MMEGHGREKHGFFFALKSGQKTQGTESIFFEYPFLLFLSVLIYAVLSSKLCEIIQGGFRFFFV